MNESFGQGYAGAYDLLYRSKDYTAECDLVERVIQTYGDRDVHSILDLGCGTGNHTLLLAERGYHVEGVDRSNSMLDQAGQKHTRQSGRKNPVFHQGDIRSVQLDRTFDVALMMFAVLGYQLDNRDVQASLKTARRHVRKRGLLIFDVWYGPAVLHQRPSQQAKVIPTPNGKVLRAASAKLDTRRHRCTVQYHLWQLDGDRLVSEVDERHEVRYYFPLELELFLTGEGFELMRIGAFPDFDREPDEMSWNIMGVAKAV